MLVYYGNKNSLILVLAKISDTFREIHFRTPEFENTNPDEDKGVVNAVGSWIDKNTVNLIFGKMAEHNNRMFYDLLVSKLVISITDGELIVQSKKMGLSSGDANDLLNKWGRRYWVTED